ncbi:serine threonine kinase, partial [Fusarium albosuccineum]
MSFFGLSFKKAHRGAENATLEAFRNEITTALARSALNDAEFLPVGQLSRLVTSSNVRTLLPGASSSLVDFICRDARKVFLTVLWYSRDGLQSVMESFEQSGMTDSHLPIDNRKAGDGSCKAHTRGICSHDKALDVFHSWSLHDVPLFYRYQWTFCPPVFEQGNYGQTYNAEFILPSISLGTNEKGGYYPTATEAALHIDHIQDKSKEVARIGLQKYKNLHPELTYDVKIAWDRRTLEIQELSEARHEHLISYIGAFKHGVDFYVMIEQPESGSLRDFWESETTKCTGLDSERIMSILEQLVGLTAALEELHSRNTYTRVSKTGPANLLWSVRVLTPDNVVRFDDRTSAWLGTLKIANRGFTVTQNPFITACNDANVKWHTLASHYGAPELVTNQNPHMSNIQESDVWSMGCIILEFLIWLLYGLNGLHEFHREGTNLDIFRENVYFSIESNGKTAHVSSIVQKWMEKMLQADSGCSTQMTKVIRNLVLLVKDRLLVVKLFGQKRNITRESSRADLNELMRSLQRIKQTAMDRVDGQCFVMRGHQPGDETNSHSDTDLRSVFSEILSTTSQTASSFSQKQRDAVGLLVNLLFYNEGLGPLYSAAVTKVTLKKLERHLAGFFREYGDGLVKEAKSEPEIRVAEFVRRNARYVAREIILRLPEKSRLDLPIEPTECSKQMIEYWLTSTNDGIPRGRVLPLPDSTNFSLEKDDAEEVESDHGSTGGSSKEDYQVLEATKQFILSAEALWALQRSLKRWLGQDEAEDVGGSSAPTETVLVTTTYDNGGDRKQESRRLEAINDYEDMGPAVPHWEKLATAGSTWLLLVGLFWYWLVRLLDPPPKGAQRVPYICGCGHLQYLDVEELATGGVAEFQESIRRDVRSLRQHAPTGSNTSYTYLPPPVYLAPSRSSHGQNQACSTLPSTEHNMPTPLSTNITSQNSPIPANTTEGKYLLVCVNTKRGLTKLEHVDVSSITNDQFLFDQIRKAYCSVRQGHEWDITGLLPDRTPFPCWLMNALSILSSIMKPEIPGEEEVLHKKTYEYRPVPLNVRVLQIPGHELLKPGPHLSCFWSNRFPKKRKTVLLCDEQLECLGWGIHITEDWNKPLVTLLALLTMLLFGLFVVIYGVLSKDWATGATIASLLVAIV